MIKMMGINTATRGQATLSFILLISGLILEIAIAGTFVTYLLSSAGLGERLFARAFTAANSGIRDVQIRIARDRGFTGTYTLAIDSDAASVSVTRVSQGTLYIYTATSTGVAGTRQRKFVAKIVADQTTGLVELQSVNEVTVQ